MLKENSKDFPIVMTIPTFSVISIYQNKMIEYNSTLPTDTEVRQNLLSEVFAEVGKGCTVETPLNSNWGCKHVHLGSGVYINSNVTLCLCTLRQQKLCEFGAFIYG